MNSHHNTDRPERNKKKLIIIGAVILFSFSLIKSVTEYRQERIEENEKRIERQSAIALKKKQQLEKEEEERRQKKEKEEKRNNRIAKVLAEVLTIQEKELFAKCNKRKMNDVSSVIYDGSGEYFYKDNDGVLDQRHLLTDSCTGLYLLKGKALYTSGQVELAKVYLSKSSKKGKEYITENNIILTDDQQKKLTKNCKLEEIQLDQAVNQIERDEKRRVEREFTEKVNERYYQYQKDYIRRN